MNKNWRYNTDRLEDKNREPLNDHPKQATVTAENGGGLCVPWGAEQFAETIISLLENPQEAEMMGSHEHARVASSRIYDQLAAIVDSYHVQLLENKR
ncbi:MAG: glycosyltransferase [Porticoccaceae bacterium]